MRYLVTKYDIYILVVSVFMFVIFPCIVMIVWNILHSPFSYPYFIHAFDVSGRRLPKIENELDRYLISGGFHDIQRHKQVIESWKKDSCEKVEHSILKKYRKSQYIQALDDRRAYKFVFMRSQTRYKQVNYVRHSYKVDVKIDSFNYDFDFIQHRYDKLKGIGFECTLNEYNTKKQRSLVTAKVRDRIKKRDDYTCQMCGKYMPDGVGIHIDHIIPVSKGGKSVDSNLRVLCAKCNLFKSDKILDELD